jgi:hypothetical protein
VTRIAIALCAAAAFWMAPAAAHAAPLSITSFSSDVSTPQAGAHPDSTVSFSVSTHPGVQNGADIDLPDGSIKDVNVDLPPGFIGNPQAVPQCKMTTFVLFDCGPASQIGLISLTLGIADFDQDPPAPTVTGALPIYNLQPAPGEPARFGTSLLFVNILIHAKVRQDGTYGLTASLNDISQEVPIIASSLTLWGVPADPSHDAERFNGPFGAPPTPAGVQPAPFLTNPSNCTGGVLTTKLTLDTWDNPNQKITGTTTSPAPSGCSNLAVNPSLSVHSDSSQADTPSGYNVDLSVPQNDDPVGLSTPPLKNVTVTLPAGTSLSPPVGDGLAGCSDAQFAATNCPNASKIGSVSIKSPLLPDPLTGGIFFASPTVANPYRIYIIASNPDAGVTISLVGSVHPDASTGRLVTTFENAPQQPFSDLKLRFFGGPDAALANPQACGTFNATSQITTYSGQTSSPSSPLSFTSGCGLGFAPGFSAGSTSPVAGGFSPFALQVTRADGMPDIHSLNVTMPPGLIAKITGVPLCSDAAAATGNCPADTQVGTTQIGAGAGSHPLYVPGNVYLTGPYKGAPFGLAIVVHAVAGPVDLGIVVVRAGISIDPHDAHLTIVSDPLPSILQGVPLRVRDVRINIDRPGFVQNPTSCAESTVGGTVFPSSGPGANVSTRFQVGDCASLPVAPKFKLATSGGHKQKSHPQVKVTLTQAAGQSNLKNVAVKLPKSLGVAVSSITVCTPAQLNSNTCPAASQVGTANAVSPLLPLPLSGPVFIVGSGTGLPALAVRLSGNGVNINVDAQTTLTKAGQVINTFPAVPDVALSSFVLTLHGGKTGLLTATKNLCTASKKASTNVLAQNGKRTTSSPSMKVGGCPKAKKHKKAKKKH